MEFLLKGSFQEMIREGIAAEPRAGIAPAAPCATVTGHSMPFLHLSQTPVEYGYSFFYRSKETSVSPLVTEDDKTKPYDVNMESECKV